jgi:two-component system, NarL family, response regulator
MSQTSPISILVADDHEVIREGISKCFENIPAVNFQVVGQACNGYEMIELFAQLRPDIGLVDLRMPKMSGLETITHIRLRFPEARLIIFTISDDGEDIYRGVLAGAKGYLLKDASKEELIQCIQNVHEGRPSLSPEFIGKMTKWREEEDEREKKKKEIEDAVKDAKLTEQELIVLRLLPTAVTNLKIAEALKLAEGTVKSHRDKVFKKLDVNNCVQAIAKGRELGLID